MIDLKCLEYPFDWKIINRKKKVIKRELLNSSKEFIEKRIAILGGSTTNEIKLTLELFLLNEGINPIFYESEYNKYYEDALFEEKLIEFNPDIVYLHTTVKNITRFPKIGDNDETIHKIFQAEKDKWNSIWKALTTKLNTIIIQNNFEFPQYRFIGNSAATENTGNVKFIRQLNAFFSTINKDYPNVYINDINYISSEIGLFKWYDNFLWNNYKYALSFEAIPYLAKNISNIIKAIYGKNKKAIALDLDNTLWGGVIGDDGLDGIVIGTETGEGEAYVNFQNYIKVLKDIGIILTIASKNEYENAVSGLQHHDMILHKDDFYVIKANWEPKFINIRESAKEINIGEDSFVFIDDNPAEREIVKNSIDGIAVPDLTKKIEDYIYYIDKNGYFEFLTLSEEDLKRNNYYNENKKRETIKAQYSNYDDYLESLEMTAEIDTIKDVHLDRIYKLINKTNQFNLTTKRYTLEEVKNMSKEDDTIIIYGRLQDKFGDNGLVSVIIGKKNGMQTLDIDLWIMSCRVLKRDLEKAMLDELVSMCQKKKIQYIKGTYIPTKKNMMVKEHYTSLGFELINEENETTTWLLDIDNYTNKNKIIKIGEY